MPAGLLDSLTTDSFHDSVGLCEIPPILRRTLQRSPLVQQIARALRSGEITETTIHEFASSVTAEFSKGQRLPNGLALSAIAVILEHRVTDFAEEFLHDLSRLRLSELGSATYVARECLKNRYLLPKNEVRTQRFGPQLSSAGSTLVAERRVRRSRSGGINVSYSRYAEGANA